VSAFVNVSTVHSLVFCLSTLGAPCAQSFVPCGHGATFVGQFHTKKHDETVIQTKFTVSQELSQFLNVLHRVILLTRFCKLLTSRHTVWGGGHVPQVPQWHDASGADQCSSTVDRQCSLNIGLSIPDG